MKINAEFYFDSMTKISVANIVAINSCEIISCRKIDNCDVFLVSGDSYNISAIDAKFRTLDNRFIDYKEYGGYTEIE